MKTRIFRVLVCFVVLCAFLISISPIRAKASTGLASLKLIEFATVTVNPYVVAGAALICLGAMAASDPQPFIDGATIIADTLGDIGSTVYRAVTDAGKTLYYVTAEYLEAVRSAAINSGIIYNQAETFSAGDVVSISNGDSLVVQQSCNLVKFVGCSSYGTWTLYEYVFSNRDENLTYYLNGAETLSQGVKDGFYRIYKYSTNISSASASRYPSIGTYGVDYNSSTINRILWCYENGLLGMTVADGYTCGLIPSVPIDGSSALKWSEEYGNRQLRVIPASGGGDAGGDQSGGFVENVLFPLALGGAISDVIGRTQHDQWSADTPSEVPDAVPETEFEILATPEIDGFQGVEIAPVTNPNPDPGTDPDSGTNPDPGENPEGGSSSGGTSDDSGGYTLDLTDFFPFCIPFDIYEFLSLLAAEPEAPVFEWVIPVPQMDTEFPISIDLSAWDNVAKLFRTLELLAFIVGLAMVTRDKFIRG